MREQPIHIRHLRHIPLLDKAEVLFDRLLDLAARAPLLRGVHDGVVSKKFGFIFPHLRMVFEMKRFSRGILWVECGVFLLCTCMGICELLRLCFFGYRVGIIIQCRLWCWGV